MFRSIGLVSLVTLILVIASNQEEKKAFEVFWNIPTYMCKNYTNFFSNLSSYGIIQNENDAFRGEKIVILYEPGHFPHITTNKTTNHTTCQHGGVPQKGDITDHLKIFAENVTKYISKNFTGIAVIDFELWRPILRHNWGSLTVYKTYSNDLANQSSTIFKQSELEEEARKQFEPKATDFMNQTLDKARELRPKASWGYYAYPYCFNINGANNSIEDCDEKISKENDRLDWLFNKSKIIFPSVYLQGNIKEEDRVKLVRGRVREAIRVANQEQKILTYIRYVYTDTLKYLEKETWDTILEGMLETGSDGVIIWGSSGDLKTETNCTDFRNYMDETLGPMLHRYSKSIRETIN